MILGMAIENASGRPFDDFLRTAIFDPLGMNHTRPEPPRRAEDTKGDSGIVSTVDDLLKWDRALAGERLVRANTLAEALVPAKVVEGGSTYGFEWNITPRDGQPYMWHQGNWGGQRAFLGTAWRSHHHHHPDAGQQSTSRDSRHGVDAALTLYEELRTAAGTRYDFSESELNGVGYALLDKQRNDDAIRVFKLNIRQFPHSPNAFDSLAEAFFRSGHRVEAAEAYSRVLELDPSNANAQAMLSKLK